jgi:hypothetical protein
MLPLSLSHHLHATGLEEANGVLMEVRDDDQLVRSRATQGVIATSLRWKVE